MLYFFRITSNYRSVKFVVSQEFKLVNGLCVFTIQVFFYSVVLYSLEKQIISRLIHKVLARFQNLPDIGRNNKYILKEKERLSNNNINSTMRISNISKRYNSLCEEKVLAVNKVNKS